MADSLRILRGNKSDMPANLGAGVLALCLDTKEVYVGDGTSNLKIGMFDEVLPITGGTVTTNDGFPFKINNSEIDADEVWLSFLLEGTSKMLLGIREGKPYLYADKSGEILHTGNKPTGSYTGNGDATIRQIGTNGIGSLIYVYCTDNSTQCIVGYYGALCWDSLGNISFLKSTEAYFRNNTLSLWSTDKSVNASGNTYKYQVL